MKILKLIFAFIFTTVLLSAQEENFPLAGVKFRTYLETTPQLSSYNLTGNEKMKSNQFSAFVNMVYPVSKKNLLFNSFNWSKSNYTILFPDGNQNDVPVWMHSMPSLTSFEFTIGIQHKLSKNLYSKKKYWELWAYGVTGLTYGSGQIDIEKQFNYTGIIQFARKWKSGTELALGGFYYHGIDGDIALPVLSLTLQKGSWGLRGMLPLDLIIFYKLNPKLKLSLSGDLHFNSFRYKTQQISQNGFPAVTSAGLVQSSIGTTIDWLVKKQWNFSFNIGFFSQQFNMQTTTGQEEILRFNDSIYFELGLSYVIF